ncbi:MAG: c-type cytochrome [Planctomycetota bacterium]|nr:c-type cytochrome [Planctomycetota bacterium]
MPYPFWETDLGYGPLMAAIAVLHVFVSHFAIGGGLYLVVAERGARRRADLPRLAFLERLSRFFALLTLVLGALTGVAIWFVIGLLSPDGTEALIRTFVWGWAIEWTFFVVEVLAALLYYYGWRRLSPGRHMAIGWVYFAAAWLSLVVINGIVTFMLTPGAWLETGAFWDGFFNPTYWPSLVLRTGICILLGGTFAVYVAGGIPERDTRLSTVRGAGLWGLTGLLVSVVGFWMYLRVDVLSQESFREVADRLVLPGLATEYMLVATALLGAGLLITAVLLPRIQRRPVGLLLLLFALMGMGSFETYREAVRKPYVIHGYMYGNGQRKDRVEAGGEESLLERIAYRTGDDGRDLFNYSCRSCHQLEGYRAIKPFFDGTDAAYISGALAGVHVMRAPMPPFAGNAEERAVLGAWIAERVDTRPLHEIHPGVEGIELGRLVYSARCASCHAIGGYGDVRETFEDFEAEDIAEVLADNEMSEEMPRFSGDETERDALIEYILSWYEEDAPEEAPR